MARLAGGGGFTGHPCPSRVWVIGLLPGDPDDMHLFFDRSGGRLLVSDGQPAQLAFYGFSPPIPDHFTWLHRIQA
jgi:hypothetical protein